jgi:L-arabinonolactonase
MLAGVECVVGAGAQLGECPLWSSSDQRLYWVDIDGRAIHRYDPATGHDEQRAVPAKPGSIALTGDSGRLLVAAGLGLAFFEFEANTWEEWIGLEPEDTGNRLNDGRCDGAGRFWVGTMFDPSSAGRSTGNLHRIGPDGSAAIVRSGIGVPNGLAFSPEGRTMYWADTPRETVWAYDYDSDTGEATNERVFLDFHPLAGKPDGACVDEDGCYWVACVYGWAVMRVTPDGRIDRLIEVPVEKPTMPAFGGRDRSTLFVTSMGRPSSEPALADDYAGGLFAMSPGVRGLPEPPFARVRP